MISEDLDSCSFLLAVSSLRSFSVLEAAGWENSDCWCSKLLRNKKLRMQSGVWVLQGRGQPQLRAGDKGVPGYPHKVGSAAEGTLIIEPLSPLILTVKGGSS